MLIGNNSLIINQATMCLIVQEWITRNMPSDLSKVTCVSNAADKGLFTITLIVPNEASK
jgi:hypothetical protein